MMPDNPQERPLLRAFLSVPLRFKITIPYLIVAALLAGLASYQVARSFVATLEERFRGQLEDASFRVADELFETEENHLTALRAIAFTLGVPEAILQRDLAVIENLVYPQIVNNQLFFVDILDASGAPLLSWHRTDGELEYKEGQFTAYQDWKSVQFVSAGASDEKGDKYAEIIETPWGLMIYTAGPIMQDDEIVGIVLVGSPLSQLVPEFALQSLANVSIYNAGGGVEISTLGEPNSLSEIETSALGQLASSSEFAYTRKVEVGSRTYVEAVDTIYLREQPSGWYYSVNLPESLVRNSGISTLLPLMIIFIIGILSLVVLGIVVAQIISIPVFRLLKASEQVGSGDLHAQVDVYSDDEIGKLSKGFNHMVNELRQREFVREMFGRMVSQDVSEAVLNGHLAIGGEARYVAVLFTDVRGFTTISEKISPDEVVSLLNQFFTIIANATRKYSGVINHFGGDSVLAVFGAPIERLPAESLRLSILTAMEIRKGIVELNAERISRALEPLRYGVGINSGDVIAGNIGTKDRFHYTVIGDVVNVAARLQGVSRQFPRTPLLIPETSVQSLLADEQFDFQYLGEYRLKGKEKPVPTYAVVGINSDYPPQFTIFDDFPYPKTEAVLACYLHCKGYAPSVIQETLQVGQQMVAQWIETGKEHAHLVGPILVQQYQLPETCLARLTGESALRDDES